MNSISETQQLRDPAEVTQEVGEKGLAIDGR